MIRGRDNFAGHHDPAGELSAYGHKLFIFDMGNVVIKNIHVLEPIAENFGLPKQDFFEDYRNYNYPLMDGTISTHQYWEHVHKKFGVAVKGEPFGDYFFPEGNPPMIALLKHLRSLGKRIACGSNTIAPHWDLLKEWGYTGYFDALYPSHILGLSKPSNQYFRFILDQEKYAPEETFFIDDYPENIEAAEKLGISTLYYVDDPDQTADEKLKALFGDGIGKG